MNHKVWLSFVLGILVLAALIFPILTQQAFADEDVHYVDPVIETTCDRINATYYRFHNGDTLNFTFTFTTQGIVNVSIPEHYTHYRGGGYLNITVYFDGGLTGYSYGHIGSGTVWNDIILTLYTTGNHTIEYNWLFTTDEDGERYLDIIFLTEVRLKIEPLTNPFPIEVLLTGGAIGAGIAVAVIGAVFLIGKARNKRPREEQL